MKRAAFRLAATAVAAILLAGGSHAQQQAPRPPNAPATGQPVPPPAPGPFSASHLAVARDVAIGSGITRSFELMAPQLFGELKKNAVTRPEVTKDLDQVIEALGPEMELQKQQMINTAAKIFASRMTEAELKDVAGFFKSPSGSKYVQTQPLVLDDLVVAMQTWSQELAEYIMVRVRAELGKRGHQLQ